MSSKRERTYHANCRQYKPWIGQRQAVLGFPYATCAAYTRCHEEVAPQTRNLLAQDGAYDDRNELKTYLAWGQVEDGAEYLRRSALMVL